MKILPEMIWRVSLVGLFPIVMAASNCYNYKGETVTDGTKFVPKKDDLCLVCVCDNGAESMCQNIVCSPPVNCKWKKLNTECCKFECISSDLDNDLEADTYPNQTKPRNEDTTVGNAASDNITTLGLRLVASTVTSFLVLALLLFMVHRLRKRRLLLAMRRYGARREEMDNFDNENLTPEYFGIQCPPYDDPPPPYTPPKPPHMILPNEAPPPYELINNNNILETSQGQVTGQGQITDSSNNNLVSERRNTRHDIDRIQQALNNEILQTAHHRQLSGSANRQCTGSSIRSNTGSSNRSYTGSSNRSYTGNSNRSYTGSSNRSYSGNSNRSYTGNSNRRYARHASRHYSDSSSSSSEYSDQEPVGVHNPEGHYLRKSHSSVGGMAMSLEQRQGRLSFPGNYKVGHSSSFVSPASSNNARHQMSQRLCNSHSHDAVAGQLDIAKQCINESTQTSALHKSSRPAPDQHKNSRNSSNSRQPNSGQVTNVNQLPSQLTVSQNGCCHGNRTDEISARDNSADSSDGREGQKCIDISVDKLEGYMPPCLRDLNDNDEESRLPTGNPHRDMYWSLPANSRLNCRNSFVDSNKYSETLNNVPNENQGQSVSSDTFYMPKVKNLPSDLLPEFTGATEQESTQSPGEFATFKSPTKRPQSLGQLGTSALPFHLPDISTVSESGNSTCVSPLSVGIPDYNQLQELRLSNLLRQAPDNSRQQGVDQNLNQNKNIPRSSSDISMFSVCSETGEKKLGRLMVQTADIDGHAIGNDAQYPENAFVGRPPLSIFVPSENTIHSSHSPCDNGLSYPNSREKNGTSYPNPREKNGTSHPSPREKNGTYLSHREQNGTFYPCPREKNRASYPIPKENETSYSSPRNNQSQISSQMNSAKVDLEHIDNKDRNSVEPDIDEDSINGNACHDVEIVDNKDCGRKSSHSTPNLPEKGHQNMDTDSHTQVPRKEKESSLVPVVKQRHKSKNRKHRLSSGSLPSNMSNKKRISYASDARVDPRLANLSYAVNTADLRSLPQSLDRGDGSILQTRIDKDLVLCTGEEDRVFSAQQSALEEQKPKNTVTQPRVNSWGEVSGLYAVTNIMDSCHDRKPKGFIHPKQKSKTTSGKNLKPNSNNPSLFCPSNIKKRTKVSKRGTKTRNSYPTGFISVSRPLEDVQLSPLSSGEQETCRRMDLTNSSLV